jgi:hypothetical protein
MRLKMSERQSVTAVTARRYQKASKSEKRAILDEFVATTGYSRWYARFVLRSHGKRVQLNKQTVVVGDARKPNRAKRPRFYDDKVLAVLIKIWQIMDFICGKRLAPILPELVGVLERHAELNCDRETKAKLEKISAATIDRLLLPQRSKYQLRGRSQTKPGTLLKHQIPIRTFADWDEQRPGFVEVDLVGHDGGVAVGDYCQTLDMTDVATTWTETMAVKNKAQVWVFEAMKTLRKNLPFPLLGLDSDNGSEFINAQLERYCRQENITFTRSRPYRKNDNCFVEQKNYSVVRRAVGYQRYDNEKQLNLLNELYSYLRLYTNFFQPSMKLLSKERVGSKVKKCYDKAQTPYSRVLASPEISKQKKKELRAHYETLNPAALKRKIDRLQQQLTKIATTTKNLQLRAQKATPAAAQKSKGSERAKQ